MRIIKLDAIDSTNTYLKKLSVAGHAEDGLAVVAKLQTQGRGQMGTIWEAQEAKMDAAMARKNAERQSGNAQETKGTTTDDGDDPVSGVILG